MWDTKYEEMGEGGSFDYHPHKSDLIERVVVEAFKNTNPPFDNVECFFTYWIEKWQDGFNPIIRSVPEFSSQIERIIWFQGLSFFMSVNHGYYKFIFHPLEHYYRKICTSEFLNNLNRMVKDHTGVDSIRMLWLSCVEELEEWYCKNWDKSCIDNPRKYYPIGWFLRGTLIDRLVEDKLNIEPEGLFSNSKQDRAFAYSFFTREHVKKYTSHGFTYMHIYNQKDFTPHTTIPLNKGLSCEPPPTPSEVLREALGIKHLFALRRIGIDVDQAVSLFLKSHKYEHILPLSKRIESSFSEIMTSELVYRATSINDKYGQELQRRLMVIDLTLQQVERFFYAEKLILISSHSIIGKQRETPWFQRSIVKTYTSVTDLPRVHELTLSELWLFYSVAYRDRVALEEEGVYSGNEYDIALELGEVTIGRTPPTESAFELRTELFGWDRSHQSARFKTFEDRILNNFRFFTSSPADITWEI